MMFVLWRLPPELSDEGWYSSLRQACGDEASELYIV